MRWMVESGFACRSISRPQGGKNINRGRRSHLDALLFPGFFKRPSYSLGSRSPRTLLAFLLFAILPSTEAQRRRSPSTSVFLPIVSRNCLLSTSVNVSALFSKDECRTMRSCARTRASSNDCISIP